MRAPARCRRRSAIAATPQLLHLDQPCRLPRHPGDKALKDGDIVNIDVTPILDGWHGDTSRMYLVGDVPLKARRLVDVTYECLMLGLEQARPGNRLGDISATPSSAMPRSTAIRSSATSAAMASAGCSTTARSGPRRPPGTGPELKPGMFFTVEPMINIGRADCKMLDDGWTAVTRDRSLSAQFEHSIGITEDGCEIFTKSPKGSTSRPPPGCPAPPHVRQ
jgi:methionyl aminopeptidase